jgi:hypothetical protein
VRVCQTVARPKSPGDADGLWCLLERFQTTFVPRPSTAPFHGSPRPSADHQYTNGDTNGALTTFVGGPHRFDPNGPAGCRAGPGVRVQMKAEFTRTIATSCRPATRSTRRAPRSLRGCLSRSVLVLGCRHSNRRHCRSTALSNAEPREAPSCLPSIHPGLLSATGECVDTQHAQWHQGRASADRQRNMRRNPCFPSVVTPRPGRGVRLGSPLPMRLQISLASKASLLTKR